MFAANVSADQDSFDIDDQPGLWGGRADRRSAPDRRPPPTLTLRSGHARPRGLSRHGLGRAEADRLRRLDGLERGQPGHRRGARVGGFASRSHIAQSSTFRAAPAGMPSRKACQSDPSARGPAIER